MEIVKCHKGQIQRIIKSLYKKIWDFSSKQTKYILAKPKSFLLELILANADMWSAYCTDWLAVLGFPSL